MTCVFFIAVLDTPVIQGVGTQTFGCLEYKWCLSHAQKWIKKSLNIEVQCEPMTNSIFKKPQVRFLCINLQIFPHCLKVNEKF